MFAVGFTGTECGFGEFLGCVIAQWSRLIFRRQVEWPFAVKRCSAERRLTKQEYLVDDRTSLEPTFWIESCDVFVRVSRA